MRITVLLNDGGFVAYEGGAKTLVQVVQDLSSARTLEQIMTLVRKAARDIAKADGATFVLRDDGFCYYADEDAISPLWKGQRFPMSACISGWSMTHHQAVIIEDIYQDSRIPIDAYAPTFVKSLVMTPIRKSDPIGAIGVYWKEKHRPTQEQLDLLQALGNTASVAMENINLYTSLEKRIDELKNASRGKDEILMTVSHELRTPLNAILGWAEILREGPVDGEELHEGLTTIERNALQQLKIVNDLVDSSLIVLGRFRLQTEPINLSRSIQQVLSELNTKIEEKKVRVKFLNASPDAIVLADEKRLKQIFHNLIDNAIKFSNQERSLTISIHRHGPNVETHVVDEGIGIDPELLPGLFEPFKQGDASITRRYGGLGLGLSIARFLTEAHKGQIAVERSTVGKGTDFVVKLPLFETVP
jgi:two-component system CheB/CheR fusion protein